jgi:LPS-assembly protein
MFNPYASVGADWGVSGHTLALGVDHRWLERSSGHQLGRISVGQSYQATTDQPARGGRRGHQTDFQAELTSAGAITGRIDLSYQHQQQAIASGFLSLSYRPGGSTLISLQHRYRTAEHLFGQAGIMPESSVSQIALQAPIGKGFQVRGLWGRNNRASKDIESLLGVSYNGCCWTVDAAYRKSFDPKLTWVAGQYQIDAQTRTGIFFSFELKGLMQIGSDMTRVLERSVPGFTAATR